MVGFGFGLSEWTQLSIYITFELVESPICDEVKHIFSRWLVYILSFSYAPA